MKNWWIKTGCLLTGWNYQILRTCTEASRKQLKKYASAILILIILWAFIGYSFAQRYVNAPRWGCIIVSVIFVIIIVQIERQIILTIGKNKFLNGFRLIIALIMAFLGSTILDQTIFKDDIEKKMIEIVDRQVSEQLPARLTVIDKKLFELQTEIDSLDRKTQELYEVIAKKPTISIISITTIIETEKQADGSYKKIPKIIKTVQEQPNPKTKESETNNKHLEELRKHKEDYTQKKMQTENTLRTELKSKQGFLEELNAIVEILIESPIALVFYLILFFFLMFLELFVVFSKMWSEESDYDLIIKHQLLQKQKQLAYIDKNTPPF